MARTAALRREDVTASGARAQVEDEEDEHLDHTKGRTRELWIAALGMSAVLPPPEEVKKVETAIGAAADDMLKSRRHTS